MSYADRAATQHCAKIANLQLRGTSAARLEFLAATTRTRIIPSRRFLDPLDRLLLHGLLKDGLGRTGSRSLCGVRSAALSEMGCTNEILLEEVARHGGKQLLEGLEVGRGAEEVVQDLVLDALHQLHKHGVGLGLVLGERVLLAVGTEVDGLAESIHGVEVLLPEAVNGVQDDILLKSRAGGLVLDLGLAVIGLDEGLRQPLAVLLDLAALKGALLAAEAHREGGVHPLKQPVDIGLGVVLAREEGGDFLRHDFVDHLMDEGARMVGIHDLVAVAVDDFSLLVHHVVELKGPAAHEVVPLLDPLLGGLDALVEPGMLELLALLHAEGLHDLGHAVGCAEVPHEVVLEADVEAGTARISLTRAASAQLAVDAARLMPLGAQDEKSAQLGDAFTELNVSSAAGHVRRDGDGSTHTGARDDLGLLHVELGVQHGVGNMFALEHAAQDFGSLDAGGTDKDRLATAVGGLDLLDGGGHLLAARLVDAVVLVETGDGAVRRDDGDIESVDVVKFVRLSLGCSGHTSELLVETEVVLDGDRRHRLGLAVDLDPFLGLDGLVEPIAPAATRHLAAGEGIDNDDLVLLDDIFDILLVEAVGLQQLGNVMHPLGGVVAVLLCGGFLGGLLGIGERGVGLDVGELREEIGEDEGVRVIGVQETPAHLGEVGLLLLLLNGEIEFFLQRHERVLGGILIERELGLVGEAAQLGILHGTEEALVAGLAELHLEEGHAGGFFFALREEFLGVGDEFVDVGCLLADKLFDQRLEAVVLVRRNGGWSTDDERGAGLVDQDGVDLIDDGVVMPALDLLLAAGRHAVISEVIEAELAVRSVGDVALVLGTALLWGLVVLDDAGGKSQESVELTHALGVAAGEVVVHCHDMDAEPGEGIEINGEGRHEGLALAGGHLGDASLVEHHAADQLDVEVNHVPGVLVVADHELHPDHAAGGVLHDCESLGEDLVQALLQKGGILNLGKLGLPGRGLLTECLVGERLE